MTKETVVLATILACVPLVRSLTSLNRIDDRILISNLSPNNAEGKLAMGAKLTLSSADMYDLELIPGVSDKLAKRILIRKAEILIEAAKYPEELRYRALEIVPGIGPKVAKKFDRFVNID